MYTGLIARRYATALAGFAAANGEERRVYDAVRHLAAVYRTDLSLRDALLSPVLPAAAKEALFRQVLDGTVSRTLEGFVSLVLRRRREKYLCFMLHSYLSLYKQRHGILDATLTTAAPVADEEADRIAGLMQMRTRSREVRLRRETDPSLIGGFVLRFDDLLVDASLARQLDTLRRGFGNKQNRIV